MDNQRTVRASLGRVILRAARALAATMLTLGTLCAIAALNLVSSPKGDLPANWPAFTISSVTALIGGAALYFIEPRLRRKN
jgi:hypothetical protein